jgi:hypothetical protein
VNLELLKMRAVLMRHTSPIKGSECRTANLELLPAEDALIAKSVMLSDLAWAVTHQARRFQSVETKEGCGTKGCVMHLVPRTQEDETTQLVAAYVPPRTIREVVGEAIRRGFMRSAKGYGN